MPNLRFPCSLILALSFVLLGACGNKGALVRPKPSSPNPPVTLPAPASQATNPPANGDAAAADKQRPKIL